MEKAVFAGGTHSGKTTLLEFFQSDGYAVVPESGIAIVAPLIESMGWEGYRTWRTEHPSEFLERIVAHQIEAESRIPEDASTVFFDRGILDYAAMALHMGVPAPRNLFEYARTHPYSTVFICETLLSRADERAEKGRFFTTEDSLKLGEYAENLYREHGYEPVRLPDIPIFERVARVKEILSLS